MVVQNVVITLGQGELGEGGRVEAGGSRTQCSLLLKLRRMKCTPACSSPSRGWCLTRPLSVDTAHSEGDACRPTAWLPPVENHS